MLDSQLRPPTSCCPFPVLQADQVKDSLHAYQLSKRGNALCMWPRRSGGGRRGARVNTISPGIIITQLAKDKLTAPCGEGYRRVIELCPLGRAGTPDEAGNLVGLGRL